MIATQEQITIQKLTFNSAALNYLNEVFLNGTLFEDVPELLLAEQLYAYQRMLEQGLLQLYVPLLDGVPAGLFYGWFLGDKIFTGHQVMNHCARSNNIPSRALYSASLAVFDDFPTCRCIMGFTPLTKRAAILVALRAGYKRCGQIGQFYELQGRWQDVAIMVKEREEI